MEELIFVVIVVVLGIILLSLIFFFGFFYVSGGDNQDLERTIVKVEREHDSNPNNLGISFGIPPPPDLPPPESIERQNSTETRKSLHLLSQNGQSDKVSSVLLKESYDLFVNAAHVHLRSKIKFKISINGEGQKIFEKGKIIKNCLNCLTVALKLPENKALHDYITFKDRNLTAEEFLDGLEMFEDWSRIEEFTIVKLGVHWKLQQDCYPKLCTLVKRGIAFMKMYEACEAEMIKSKGIVVDERLHEIVGDGKRLISLLPGLERNIHGESSVICKEILGYH